MTKTDATTVSTPVKESRGSFFRQSGWMLFATTASGFLMYAVHMVVGKEAFMPTAEYGVFMTLLQVLNMMIVPAIGLQLVFVQQTVSATSETDRRQLSGTVREVFGVAFLFWLGLVVVAFLFQDEIVVAYKISHRGAIWATVGLALMAVVNPVMMGMLQGKMNFLWYGWAVVLNGLGRLLAIALIVIVLGGHAAGAMTGALLGMLVSVGIAAWHTRDIWLGPAERMQWWAWLKRVVPLSVGFGAATVMLSVDMVVVQRFFAKEETGYYAAAGMIGRALVFLTAPLTQVMFPKVVQSAARSEKSNVMAQALGATALLGACAALGCTLLPELPLRIVYDSSYLKIAPLVPLFAWCMLPLTLANVLINNLLARRRFGVVIWLAIVAAGYGATLWNYHPSFEAVIKTLGIFGTLFMGGCLVFSLRRD